MGKSIVCKDLAKRVNGFTHVQTAKYLIIVWVNDKPELWSCGHLDECKHIEEYYRKEYFDRQIAILYNILEVKTNKSIPYYPEPE